MAEYTIDGDRLKPACVPTGTRPKKLIRPPAKRARGRERRQPGDEPWLDKTPAERHAAMTWMQRLKRVLSIDIESCERCAGQVKIIVLTTRLLPDLVMRCYASWCNYRLTYMAFAALKNA